MENKLKEKLNQEKIVNILNDFYSQQENEIEEETKVNKSYSKDEIANYIDHTLLKPEAQIEDVKKLCYEAKEFNFFSVCINPSFVNLCKNELKGTNVKICTVIGFPLGATTTSSKVYETNEAIKNGADEVDMVLNIGKLKDGDVEYIFNDIQKVAEAAENKALLKVIIETCLLSDAEKVKACLIAKEAGADFVKTSTGFSKGGATEVDIALMRFVVGNEMGVKASGGVRNLDDAINMIENGATRIGASSSVNIVLGINDKSKGY